MILQCNQIVFKDDKILDLFVNINPRVLDTYRKINVNPGNETELFIKTYSHLIKARYLALELHTGNLLLEEHHNEVHPHLVPFLPKNYFSVIICTKRPDFVPNIIDNVVRQQYKQFELLILFDGEVERDKLESMKSTFDNNGLDYRIFFSQSKINLGSGLNFLVEKARYPIITKWDDDDVYLSNYLKHLNLDWINLAPDVAGKYPEFIAFEGDSKISHDIGPGSHVFGKTFNFSGSTLTFSKNCYMRGRMFPDLTLGEDELYRQNSLKAKDSLVRLPGFDHVVRRFGSGHTWQYSTKEWKLEIEDQNIHSNRTNVHDHHIADI
jgi:hypothetical protein